ncbi:isopropylmalate isomerase [Nitrospinae bacterium AH_259_B05_G02_I21]|nr:isopropylmalate isomerase [Nitrospinae bacterium AH_259_B05_G02_I21]
MIPARYLRSVTFEGLEEHLFEDERRQAPDHPFNQERHRGASVLLVGHNFGCGSSREHAPVALQRWGIRGIVGGSFAEIFLSNAIALGIPCLTVDEEALPWLMEETTERPEREILIDVESRQVSIGERSVAATIADSHRNQLLFGTWNATLVLLEAGEAIEEVAGALPYVTGY